MIVRVDKITLDCAIEWLARLMNMMMKLRILEIFH